MERTDRGSAAAAERRQPQHLPPGGDGAVELGEAQAVRARPGSLGELVFAALQRPGDVLERAGDLAQQRRGGAVHGFHGVARQQRGDGDRDDAAEQRVEEAHADRPVPGAGVIGALMLGFLAVVPAAVVLVARHGAAARRATLPLGPFLALGAAVVLLA